MTRAQLGSIQRLDKDRYRIFMTDGYKDGKQVRRSKVVRGSRDDAEIELAKMKLSAGQEVDVKMTVHQFYESVYEASLSRVRARTKEGYISTYKRHIKPRFGDILLANLTPLMIEEKLWEIPTAGAQRHVYAIFRQIVNMAYTYDFIEKNPFHKRIRLRPKEHYEPEVFLLSEFPTVLEAIRDENIEPLILVMMFGGLRREEACGLWWSDISVHDGNAIVRVERGLQCVKEKAVEVPTKTERSTRSVVISSPAAERLIELKKRAQKPPKGKKSALAPNRANDRMNPNVVMKRWKEICKDKGLKYVPLKNLRTSYATALKQNGVDNATISELLGHTHLSTAYDHYFAVNMDAHKGIAEALGSRLSTF